MSSGLKNIYPVSSKNADDVELSIRHFCGERPVTGFYSDNSGELKKALKSMKILHEGSQPGVPQTNAVIERTNQDIVCGARCCLDAAGLPPCFWSFAAPCYCLLENTAQKIEHVGVSSWFHTHIAYFEGL